LSAVPSPAHVLASPPPASVLNKSSAAYDATPVSIHKSLLPVTSVDSSIPGSPSPLVLPLPNAELLTLLDGTASKGPFNNAMQPRLSAHRPVHNGNMCLANAVLHLLVYCPPFLDIFKELGPLMGQREGGETGTAATPLMNATVRFLDEFAYKEKSSLTQQFLPRVSRGDAREAEKDAEENGVVDRLIPTYVFDAMKEKRQFINVKIRSCAVSSATDAWWYIANRTARSRMRRSS
jgi:ubiquitin carboxyl-terminal hydrolase 10